MKNILKIMLLSLATIFVADLYAMEGQQPKSLKDIAAQATLNKLLNITSTGGLKNYVSAEQKRQQELMKLPTDLLVDLALLLEDKKFKSTQEKDLLYQIEDIISELRARELTWQEREQERKQRIEEEEEIQKRWRKQQLEMFSSEEGRKFLEMLPSEKRRKILEALALEQEK